MAMVVTLDGIVGVTVDSAVVTVGMGMAVDMVMRMGMDQIAVRMRMGMAVAVFVGMLQGYGVLDHQYRGYDHDPESNIELDPRAFLQAYHRLRRNYYAEEFWRKGHSLSYAANDVVLIVLWLLAAMENITYISVIICFAVFLVNDLYGFISW